MWTTIPVDVQTVAIAEDAGDVANVYGDIYVTGGSTGQAISSTPAKLTAFAANGQSAGVTADHTNDRLTVATTGIYLVGFNVTLSVTSSSLNYKISARVDQVEPTEKIIGELDFAATSVPGIITGSGLLSLTADEQVELYVDSSSSTPNITVREAHLWCQLIG